MQIKNEILDSETGHDRNSLPQWKMKILFVVFLCAFSFMVSFSYHITRINLKPMFWNNPDKYFVKTVKNVHISFNEKFQFFH